MKHASTAFRKLLRHAERFGVEGVYEEALEQSWDAVRLADFARELREQDQIRHDTERAGNPRHYVEPPWTLSQSEKDELIRRLLDERLSARMIADLVGVRRSRVSTLSGRMETEDGGSRMATRMKDPQTANGSHSPLLEGLEAAEYIGPLEPADEPRSTDWHAWVYGGQRNPAHL